MSPFAVGNRHPDDGDEPVRWPWVAAGVAAAVAVAAVVIVRRKK